MVAVLFRLVVAFFVGLASHQLDKPTRALGPKVGLLTKFSIGLLVFIPLSILVKGALPKPAADLLPEKRDRAEDERDFIAGLLTAGAQGSGVFLGYALDSHDQ